MSVSVGFEALNEIVMSLEKIVMSLHISVCKVTTEEKK
jgi:hypothetical protein